MGRPEEPRSDGDAGAAGAAPPPGSASPARRARVTRNDVAREAGVSVAVVSYVLSGSERSVALATAERVRRVASELGYRPNRLARGLRSGRSTFVGMVTPDTTNPFFAMLLRDVENAAFARDHLVLMGSSEQDPNRERHYLQAFSSLRVAGILLVSCAPEPEPLMLDGDQTGPRDIPIVLLDRICEVEHGAAVLVDNHGGAAVATRHLLEHGRRRIACVTGPPGASTATERLEGYTNALRAEGVAPESDLVLHGAFDRRAGYQAADHLLNSPEPPDAFFVASDQQAMGVLDACYRHQRDVPTDVAVVGFDDIPQAGSTVPTLTTVAQPLASLAVRALDLVTGQQPLPTDGNPIRIPVDLRIRESCGCPSDDSAEGRPDGRKK